MFTILLTIIGVFVFIIAMFKTSFGKSFSILVGFVVTGVVLDVFLILAAYGWMYCTL